VISKRLFIKPEQENLRADFVARWAENDPKAYMNSMKAIIGWSVQDQLDRIECPALVLTSDEDYSPVSDKQAIVDRLKHAELVVIEEAHHALPVEKPEAFNQALKAFLANLFQQ
jgi:pimeloyl-ACP methyl ester carboxylesterase